MENVQATQNGVVTTAPEDQIQKTYEKSLFETNVRCFKIPLTQDLVDGIVELVNQQQDKDHLVDVLTIEDNPSVQKIKEFVYSICAELSEFAQTEGGASYLPKIIGSNVIMQQVREHVPLHCYEFVPLTFTFVLNTGTYPQFTYFADTRGGVQTIRQKITQNLVGSSFGLRGQVGEVIVTQGYVQRYTETNLSDQTQVFLNVMVGYDEY